MPASAVIPTPEAIANVVAVKKFVVQLLTRGVGFQFKLGLSLRSVCPSGSHSVSEPPLNLWVTFVTPESLLELDTARSSLSSRLVSASRLESFTVNKVRCSKQARLSVKVASASEYLLME